ncbi:hypothetical protein U0C82_12930 [Fulvimarina sp. 2208YS6-2-32]|uniref:Uncharacterized protein n=1 Tax=Fulvimarina uroteuthidis TaxID=3098149 RepID=A0ABU5I3T3_9HYPH|nr:hypothetical protein [Fulvimarina sp. 2208YS6-2-32]MDY8110044.1 hypothetical protein [Fulvimarina sp. 2208YS6-2-32]
MLIAVLSLAMIIPLTAATLMSVSNEQDRKSIKVKARDHRR